MDKKFSILTACYNNKRFLPTLVKSVFSQSSSDWEWIIVDDASSDGSWDVLKEIKHKNVKLFRNEKRMYCSSTYARSLRESTGVYCGVLDADDALAPHAVKTILRKYKEHTGVAYIYTQHSWCDTGLRRLKSGLSSAPPDGLTMAEAASMNKHCFSHWRTFRRSVVSDVDFLFRPGLQFAVDKAMGFSLEELGVGAFLPKELYKYRYYKGNMSLTCANEQRKTWRSLAQEYLDRRRKDGIKAFPIKVIS